MINKLWEYGWMENPNTKEIGYGIMLILDTAERKEFEGKDIAKVRSEVMDFICKHYFNQNQTTGKLEPPTH